MQHKRVIGFVLASLLLISNATCLAITDGSAALSVDFVMEQNDADSYSAHMILKNNTNTSLENWTLWYNTPYAIQSAQGVDIVHTTGDFWGFHGQNALPAGGSVTIPLQGQHLVQNVSQAPVGYFLTTQDTAGNTTKYTVDFNNQLLPWTPNPDEYNKNLNKNAASIEGNPANSSITPNNSLIVPLPVSLVRGEGKFIFTPKTSIKVQWNNAGAQEAAQFLQQAVKPAMGSNYRLPIRPWSGDIVFTSVGATKDLGEEGYLLIVRPKQILISANSSAGFFYGVQTLRQLMPPQIMSKQQQKNILWTVPEVTIKDYPRFAYRGLHLDVARHYFTPAQVKRLLDLMAFNKLNVFHWHISDDEGWRIQINKYPQLTQIGSTRGFNQILQPALGSGYAPYGGYYTQEDIRGIVKYAQIRHIEIIPEIDMPGHARAMIKSLPDLLVDPQDQSTYTSVQGYNDNVLSPCISNTYTVIQGIMSEVASLFPGKYIHVGGDERPKGAWENSPNCQAIMQQNGLTDTEQLQNYFMKKVQQILAADNKTMAGWQEVTNGGTVDPSTLVYAWTSADGGRSLAEQGYPVIMMPAQSLYFDLAYNADPYEIGYNWAGYVDTFIAYSFSPAPADWPSNVADKIQGVEGALWSENLTSADQLDYMAFPKAAALAEVAWTPAKRRNWQDFSARMGQYYLPHLDYYGVKYRISPPGIRLQNNILEANDEFPGLALRYTLDGTDPIPSSSLYQGPVQVNSTNIKIRAFTKDQRGSTSTSPGN